MVATISSALETCLDDSQLLSYVQGKLAPAERERVELHVSRCDACCELLAESAKLFEADATQPLSSDLATITDDLPSPPPSSGDAHVGQHVGRYELRAVLGRGGAGVVYAAHDPELHRRVAIKLLRSDIRERDDEDASRARLLREARAMARVAHPHVVSIFDVGVWNDQVFVAMELVEGRTFRSLIRDPKVTWQKRLECLMEAGRGLAAAHAAGLVHRDFKPENVLVGDDGRVKVSDFGLAKPVRADEGSVRRLRAASHAEILTSVTMTGHVVGTPAYMAPEQFLDGSADARADQFAFSVVLHEALFGARPFAGSEAGDIARNVLESRITPARGPADVPPGLRGVVERGIARDANARYPSLDALLADIEGVRSAASNASNASNASGTPAEAADIPTRRSPLRVVLTLAAALGLGAIGLAVSLASGRSTPAPLVVESSRVASSASPPSEPTESRTVAVTAPASAASHATVPPAKAPPPRGTARAAHRPKPLGDRVENPF